MKKLYIGLLLPFSLYAENLIELVDLSLHNQLVKSTEQNIDAIKQEYTSVQRKYLPKVTLGASYSNTNKETANTAKNSFTSYANVNYVVYDGGKKGATYDGYKNNINSANENLITLKNDMTLQVINYYFKYYSYVAEKEAKQKEIEQLQAQYSRLVKFLNAGTTTSDEVDKIIARVENANVALHESELNIQTTLHNLSYLTSNNIKLESGATIAETDFTNNLSRSDIKAMEYDIQTQISNARAVKSDNYPTVTLDNTFNQYDMHYDEKAYDDAAIDSQNIFKVNLTWNIFDFGATTNAYESEYKKYQSLKSEYEYEKNKANVDLQLAIKSYNITKLKIKSAKLALKASLSTYDSIEQKFQNGLVDNIAYLEALSEKYSAVSFLKTAEYDLEIKKANIIYYSGKNVWEYIK